MTFQQDYMRGLDALCTYAPYFYRIMRFLGIPRANEEIDTACVSYDPNSKEILFEINPALINGMDDENVAFVIAHEAYHVILRHLQEVRQTDEFPDAETLIYAHESIVNDTVKNILGLDEPDLQLIFGDRFGADFSGFSTREAYDWIKNDDENASGEGDSIESDGSDTENDSADGDGQNNSNGAQGCGGFNIPEGFEDDFMNVVSDNLKDAMQDIKANKENVPDEMLDALDSIDSDITGGYGIGEDNGSMFIGETDDMNLDWKQLVAEINPKIMSAGGGPKYKDTWTSPNRRMTSVYPKVILPNRVRVKQADENGDDAPLFILALDMSYSIPTYLIAGLSNLADTVPEKFVKVLPISWSDYALPFDTKKKKIVSRSGTNINAVWEYSQEVKKQYNQEPYVFVITDGEFHFSEYLHYGYGNRSLPNKDVVQKFWYWGGIDNRNSISALRRNNPKFIDNNKIYNVNDFLQ